jgi:predicted phosphate transport protein (TIGR00153 family)
MTGEPDKLPPSITPRSGNVARISFVPQNREFFRLLERASDNAVGIARLLVRMLDEFPSNGNLLREIKELEHEGDRLTREVVDLLNRTFVTPFDRDDTYRLAGALDDVCDHIDEAAGNIVGYGVEEVRPLAKEQAYVLVRSAEKLHQAVRQLDGFKDASAELEAMRDLEDEGDRLNRDAVSELFKSVDDPIAIIRWKDIHEQLEEAVDACENAADILEAILVKNR